MHLLRQFVHPTFSPGSSSRTVRVELGCLLHHSQQRTLHKAFDYPLVFLHQSKPNLHPAQHLILCDSRRLVQLAVPAGAAIRSCPACGVDINQLIVIALHDGVVYASNVRAIELSPADRTGNEALFSDLVNDTCAAKLVDCRGGA
jgi:hypothetical protein